MVNSSAVPTAPLVALASIALLSGSAQAISKDRFCTQWCRVEFAETAADISCCSSDQDDDRRRIRRFRDRLQCTRDLMSPLKDLRKDCKRNCEEEQEALGEECETACFEEFADVLCRTEEDDSFCTLEDLEDYNEEWRACYVGCAGNEDQLTEFTLENAP
ncbi:unnamed protein product [Chrysoparadoxa australica]